MQAIRCTNSRIEMLLRKELWRRGHRYRINCRGIEGKPDIVFSRQKVAIFCDSEFWHGYDWGRRRDDIKSHQSFWIPKIERNIERDAEVNDILRTQGWTVLRFWGEDIVKNLDHCVSAVETAIREGASGAH